MKLTEEEKANLKTTLRRSESQDSKISKDTWEFIISNMPSEKGSENEVIVRVNRISSLFE